MNCLIWNHCHIVSCSIFQKKWIKLYQDNHISGNAGNHLKVLFINHKNCGFSAFFTAMKSHTEYNKLQLNSNNPHVATGTRSLNCCASSNNCKKKPILLVWNLMMKLRFLSKLILTEVEMVWSLQWLRIPYMVLAVSFACEIW